MARGTGTDGTRQAAIALAEQGRLHEAKARLETLCSGTGAGDAEAWFWLGRVQGRLGDAAAAADCCRRAVTLRPGHAAAQLTLGKALHRLHRRDEAAACYRTALCLDPNEAEVYSALGYIVFEQGGLEEAAQLYEQAVRLAPQSPEAYYNLGNIRKAQRRYEEAATAYHEALRLRPGFAAACNNLGATLYKLGNRAAALAQYERALQLDPSYAEAYCNLGTALRDQGRVQEAVQHFQHALEHNPGLIEAYMGLSSTARRGGDAARAVAELRRALAIAPDRSDVRGSLLTMMCYLPETTVDVMFDAAREWERRHAAPLAGPRPRPAPRGDARLRIGYVSGDLHGHPVGYFMGAVLGHHDRARYEIYCYNNDISVDAQTALLKAAGAQWRDVAGWSDAALFDAIRRDGIDILVDLSGHTAHNRLPVFARRAAPVQVTWMGYFATTGLSAMDYILADATVIPPADADRYSEAVVRLPHSYVCFAPPDYPLAPAPAPSLDQGCVTFGSFNNPAKVTPAVVDCWAQVLQRTPGSRLFMKYNDMDSPDIQQRYLAMFARHGIAAERIRLSGRSPRRQFLECYRDVDIALDPFPYNGGVTTMEALWMGVPVVALEGDRFVARVGASLLRSAGLHELIACTGEEYVAIAARLALDTEWLMTRRRDLRARVMASPLCDGPAFTAAVEAAYQEMWERLQHPESAHESRP